MRIELGGILFGLFIFFLVLKIEGVVLWSWWIITLPLWLPFALWLALAIIVSGTIIITQWFWGYRRTK